MRSILTDTSTEAVAAAGCAGSRQASVVTATEPHSRETRRTGDTAALCPAKPVTQQHSAHRGKYKASGSSGTECYTPLSSVRLCCFSAGNLDSPPSPRFVRRLPTHTSGRLIHDHQVVIARPVSPATKVLERLPTLVLPGG